MRRTIEKYGPDPIDIQVGQRLRKGRRLANQSQSDLAAAIGVSFQAVQKYESGDNRLSASRLFAAAKFLGQPISFFFEQVAPSAVNSNHNSDHTIFNNKEIELIRWLRRISDSGARESIIKLVKQMGTLHSGPFSENDNRNSA